MTDPQDQLRQAARDVAAELQRVIDQAGRLARQEGEDFWRLVGPPRTVVPRWRDPSASHPVPQLGPLPRVRPTTDVSFPPLYTRIL